MVRVVIHDSDGAEQIVEGDEGDSIMRTALAAGVRGIIGECGGEMSCGTCHVYVGKDVPAGFRSADEEDLLESLDNVTECSRLSCQIRLSPELEGAEFRVASEN